MLVLSASNAFLLHRLSEFWQSAARSHWISGQVLSIHWVVSTSWTVRPWSWWRGQWIGHWRTTWPAVCSSAPHSQAAEGAIPHLYKQERKRLTPVWRRFSRTYAVFGRVIPGGWVPMLGMKVRNLAVLCNHFASAFHRDPRRAPHVCCCYQINWWVVMQRVQMGVPIWGASDLHSVDGWALRGADV